MAYSKRLGLSNCLLLSYYSHTAQSQDIYGKLSLTVATVLNQDAWFEKTKRFSRVLPVESQEKNAKVWTWDIMGLQEKDILVLQQKSYGNESPYPNEYWEVQSINRLCSIPDKKIVRSIEINLTMYV